MDKKELYDICLKAVSRNGLGELCYVPEDMITPEMCLRGIEASAGGETENGEYNRELLSNIPKDIIRENPCVAMKMIESYGDEAALFIDDDCWTEEMCLAFLTQTRNSRVLPVFAKKMTDEMYMTAVRKNPRLFESVPEKFITEEMCLSAVSADGSLLRFVPREYKSEKVIETALEACPSLVSTPYIPDSFRTPGNIIRYFKKSPDRYISDARINPMSSVFLFLESGACSDMLGVSGCIEALKTPDGERLVHSRNRAPLLYRFLEDAAGFDGNQMREMFEKLSDIYPDTAVFVPEAYERYMTGEMYAKAVKADPQNLCRVPEKYMTYEMCLNAVRDSSAAISCVPDRFRTEDMIRTAAEGGCLRASDIPRSFFDGGKPANDRAGKPDRKMEEPER